MFNLVYDNRNITFGDANVGYELPYAFITYSAVDHGTVTGVATAQIGSTVTVTATPGSGYTLSYITVNGTQIVGDSFVVTGNAVVGAVFVEAPSYTLEIIFNGTGYDHAFLAIRSMSPNASNFKYTSDGHTYYYNNPTNMNSTTGDGQYFETLYPDPTFVATAVLVPSDAYVLSFEIRNRTGASAEYAYTYNVTNTETQEPVASGTFTLPLNNDWQQCSITVKECDITYSTVQHGTVTGVGTTEFGSTVTVTAVPEAGYILSYITVNGTQIEGNSFVATGNATVGAVFTKADEVTIGNQVWKTHNLAINDNGGGIIVVNGEYYYTQDAAIRVAATVTGWHLPSTEEFNTLITNAGGFNGLAAAESWTYGGGDNSSGFGALAKGEIVGFVDPNNPVAVGIDAVYWSSNTSNQYSMELYHGSDSAGSARVSRGSASSASVRLIKD